MKTVTAGKFYADTTLVDKLPEGGQIVVTSGGKAKFVVTKGGRPRMTRSLAEERAVGGAQSPVFDGAAFLKTLKK